MPRRVLQGTVVSDKVDQMAVVSVLRAVKHPLYGKTIRKSKKYHAHDETNGAKVGDTVFIRECPPRSATKTWEIFVPGSADVAQGTKE